MQPHPDAFLNPWVVRRRGFAHLAQRLAQAIATIEQFCKPSRDHRAFTALARGQIKRECLLMFGAGKGAQGATNRIARLDRVGMRLVGAVERIFIRRGAGQGCGYRRERKNRRKQ